jgi:hypothetical protein
MKKIWEYIKKKTPEGFFDFEEPDIDTEDEDLLISMWEYESEIKRINWKEIKEKLIENNKEIQNKSENYLEIYNENSYEILLSNKYIKNINEEENNIVESESENGVKYYLGLPSDGFRANLLISLLNKLETESEDSTIIIDEELKEKMSLNRLERKGMRNEENETNEISENDESFEDFFYDMSLNERLSLRIETTKKMELEEFRELFNSFCFKYAFKEDVLIEASKEYIYEIFEIKRKITSSLNTLSRLSEIKEIEVSKKYESRLINFYRTGIKAEDPYIQYLSYYHILEYHYYRNLKNKVANELKEKLEDIQNNKVEDVASNIIKIVNKGTQERTVLKSILEENITDDIQNLKDRIIEINNNVSYRTSINFSNASSINWNESVSNIITQITNRIYDTRNSLVHSKKDEIEKIYEPWNDKHVKELKKEIPLIRALAELIIENTGENINLD